MPTRKLRHVSHGEIDAAYRRVDSAANRNARFDFVESSKGKYRHSDFIPTFDIDFSYCDLSGYDFTDYVFIETNFTGACFRDSVLTGADFEHSILVDVNINGPELCDIEALAHATVSVSLLPWLSCHPLFAVWLPTLTIVENR